MSRVETLSERILSLPNVGQCQQSGPQLGLPPRVSGVRTASSSRRWAFTVLTRRTDSISVRSFSVKASSGLMRRLLTRLACLSDAALIGAPWRSSTAWRSSAVDGALWGSAAAAGRDSSPVPWAGDCKQTAELLSRSKRYKLYRAATSPWLMVLRFSLNCGQLMRL